MNCDGCQEKLERYVDRELTASELDEVKQHLDDCPPCADFFQLQESFKKLVRRKGCPETAPPELVQRIIQRLRAN